MHGLELIVSNALSSLAKAEDKIVNFAYASRLATKHPVTSGIIGGAGLAGAIAYLHLNVLHIGVKPGLDIYTLAIPAAVAGTGFMLYDLAKQHREVSDAGLSVEKFYKLSGRKGNQRKAALLLSAVSLAAVNAYAYHSGSPPEMLARMDLVAAPAIYLAARSFMNAFKPISNASSFRAAIIEGIAFIASKVTGNRQIHIKALESDARNFPSAQTEMELAEAYFSSGRLDDGLLETKAAMEQKTGLSPSFPPRAGRKSIEIAASSHKAIRTGKPSHIHYIAFSRSCQAIGETKKAQQTIRQMTERFPSIESDILAAMFLDASGNEQESAAYWGSAVSAILSKPELKVLPVSEQGVHNVRRYGPSPMIASTFVFKGADSHEQHEFEKRMIPYVRQILKSSFYALPQVVAEFAHKNGGVKYELVLRYLEGQSPSEMRQAGTLEQKHLLSIIDYLSWIHKTVKPELSGKGRIKLDAKLEQILNNRHLGLPDLLADGIRANIGFIVEEQKDSPYVFAKDPHPAQWRFGRDCLAALDWEDMGATPLFVDSAKLYAHPDVLFTEDTLDTVHREAAVLYRELFGDDSEFRARQLDAMLFQPLSFASAWSVPEMSHMRSKRAAALAITETPFGMIRQNHPNHYRSNRLRYDGLESDFMRAREILAAN